MTLRGNIETYSLRPTDPGAYGSVTVTNGVKITAHAYYNHLISEFDSMNSVLKKKDTYVFSYQVKISVDENAMMFDPCILVSRTWIIEKGPNNIMKVENQAGVIGQFPILWKGCQPFIYESQCPTHVLGTKMRGHYIFKYLDGKRKDDIFYASIGEFTLELTEN